MNVSVSPIFDDPSQEYPGAMDYAEIFIDQMNRLYLLSYLLTADTQVAENCFSNALDEYVENTCGFMEWAMHDGRRAVLRHAVRIISPAPKRAYSWTFHRNARPLLSAAHQPFEEITSLGAFERFVFVMSLLEGLSEGECAALLNCSDQDVAIARELARGIIAGDDLRCDLTSEMDVPFVPNLMVYHRSGVC